MLLINRLMSQVSEYTTVKRRPAQVLMHLQYRGHCCASGLSNGLLHSIQKHARIRKVIRICALLRAFEYKALDVYMCIYSNEFPPFSPEGIGFFLATVPFNFVLPLGSRLLRPCCGRENPDD